jgi:hypothetical protein
MVNADGLEPLGRFILYVFAPIHVIVVLWFISRRHVFPISGRHPSLSIFLMGLAVPCTAYIGYQLLVPTSETPCWLSWYIFGPATCAFLPIQTVRATLLLCQFEITKDLQIAESLRNTVRQRQQQQQQLQSPSAGTSSGGGIAAAIGSPSSPLVPLRVTLESPHQYRSTPSSSTTPSHAGTAQPLLTTFAPSFWTRNRYIYLCHFFLWR